MEQENGQQPETLSPEEAAALAAFREGKLQTPEPQPVTETLSPEEAAALAAFREGKLIISQPEAEKVPMTAEEGMTTIYDTLTILVNNSPALSADQRAKFHEALEAV